MMKSVLLILLLIPITVNAASFDTVSRNIGYGLILIDWSQTHEIKSHDDLLETNARLGQEPTAKEINIYFTARLFVHWFYNTYKPFDLHKIWNVWVIIDGGSAVVKNYQLGLKINF